MRTLLIHRPKPFSEDIQARAHSGFPAWSGVSVQFTQGLSSPHEPFFFRGYSVFFPGAIE